jgi:hypothetical protein
MIKRKGMNQIGNLTPDHKSFESRGEMKSILLENFINPWKNIFKGYKILPSHSQNKLDLKKI